MKRFLWFFIVLPSVWCQAQKFDLGNVTKEELMQARHPIDSSAAAAILFDIGKTNFEYDEQNGFVAVTEVKTKIKIYKKEGYDWASRQIAYYTGDRGSDKLSFSNAATYNLVDGKVVKTKLKSEGEFSEKVNRFWSQKKITMPNVKEGSVIEYSYMLTSPRIGSLDDWNFQSSIPVNYSEFEIRVPEYLVYSSRTKGFLTPKITSDSRMRKMYFRYTTKDVPGMNGNMPKRVSDEVEFKENITKYVLTDIPALKDEDYVNNINNYVSGAQFELSMTRYPDAPIKTFSTSWESVVKTIYDADDFGPELKKTGYFEQELDVLLSGVSGVDDKTAVVYNFVKSRMNWNGFNGYGCNDGVRKAYKDKVGNVAEINLMLTAMLRYAGVSANPVLVSTRSNGISYFPNHSAYNYVVCAVEKNEQVILLDATDKYALPNIVPVRALNWFGRIIRQNGSSAEVSLMPKTSSKDVINMIASLDAQGKLTGKLRDQYFDYNAYLYRSRFAALSKESYLEKLEKRFTGLEIGDDYTAVSDDFSKPVTESYSFVHNGVSEIIGDKIYFSPLVFFAEHENPFKQDKREYPVDFVFPNQDKYSITINLPEGYVVESTPTPAMVTFGDIGKFTFNISSTGKQIQLACSYEMNEAIVSSEDYPALKDFYKAMIDKQTEKVVLKKI